MTFLPGSWSDVTRRGTIVRELGDSTAPGDLIIGQVQVATPDWLLWTRADESDEHGVVVVGQGWREGHAWVWTQRAGWRSAGLTWGASPCETDGRLVYVVRAPSVAVVLELPGLTEVGRYAPPEGSSQGWLDCTVLGLLWTDLARRVRDVTLPQDAGEWLVGQHATRSAIVAQRGAEAARLVADGVVAYEPRACVLPDGRIRVVSRTPHGVYYGDHDPATWPIADPEPVESPVGTPVRVWDYLVGYASTWPRTGTHGMNCTVTVDGPGYASAWFVKFDTPTTWERWSSAPDGWIYHVEDHSEQGHRVYQFSDGRWLKAEMRVGETIACPDNHIRWHDGTAWGPWAPFPYRTTLDRHQVWPDGREQIVWTYDPGTARDTHEVYTGDSAHGWSSWERIDDVTGARLAYSDWPAPGHVTVTPVGALVPWPAPRPIVTTPPPVEVPVKSREQFVVEFNEVNAFYAAPEGLQREGGMVLNAAADTEAMGAWGYDLLALNKTVDQVKASIRQSDEWKVKHPGEASPPP